MLGPIMPNGPGWEVVKLAAGMVAGGLGALIKNAPFRPFERATQEEAEAEMPSRQMTLWQAVPQKIAGYSSSQDASNRAAISRGSAIAGPVATSSSPICHHRSPSQVTVSGRYPPGRPG